MVNQIEFSDWLQVPMEVSDEAADLNAIHADQSARLSSLDDIRGLLVSPDTRMPLTCVSEKLAFPDGEPVMMIGERPLLLPEFARKLILSGKYSFGEEATFTPGQQYLLLADIKSKGGDQNSAYDDIWYRRHCFRTRRLTAGASGSVLDVGCDAPGVSRKMFPVSVNYLGLEPSLLASNEFCICGMAEYLPFQDSSFDNVSLLTSLDHILDHHRAIEEARRVLRPGGALFLASLVWHSDAAIIGDTVHFHHFRDWELQGLLNGFKIETLQRYVWKDNKHRYGVYLKALKF